MTDLTPLPERALSIRQPWAWAIINAGKDIENRPRRFHYRGPICIHASLYKPKPSEIIGLERSFGKPVRDALDVPCPLHPRFQRGGIIGTAEIVDCVETSDSPWFFGPYGLVMRNVQPVHFIPVKGALGLFRWRKNLEREPVPFLNAPT
jgi:hypothetical protein